MRFRFPVAAAFCACALAAGAQAQTVVPGATPAHDAVALAPDGLARALETLPATVEAIMRRSSVPGMAVAVVHRGETVFLEGFGVRSLATGAPVTPDTVFQIASISKSVSATVAAIAVTDGLVGWDDPIRAHLPAFALSDARVGAMVTVGDMFAHRSGLPHAAGDDLEDLGFSRAAILERLVNVPLDSFRTAYNYANFGITAGAEAVAAAAGKPWEELAAETLYGPLGMEDTSSRHADFVAHPERATLHAFEDGRFRALYERDPDEQSPAGGVSSTARDLAAWLALLLAGGKTEDGTLFAPEALLPALRPQVVSGPAHAPAARSGFYGYGFNVGVTATGRPVISHSGAFLLGAATNFHMLPGEELGIVVLSNGGPVGAVEAVAAHFLDVVQFGAPARDWFAAYNGVMAAMHAPVGDLAGAAPPRPADPARPLARYAGRYANAYFGDATVGVAADGLVLRLGPDGMAFPLAHWSGDTFAVSPRGENAPAGSRSSVRFDVQAGSLVIEYLDAAGQGTWTRAAD
ncbi:serine hydrolase [Aquibium sp. A9E412]|uniref:serine hydrolase n=1 Tax=Aquibium sp. A9E412 TaxID=2976767 RepID=UPI0025B1B3AB|nr:serine hydrolase [Aquibium sp. A9E412]MDN2564916.1 serine hydrolase [Aquibium sp. A9E412]